MTFCRQTYNSIDTFTFSHQIYNISRKDTENFPPAQPRKGRKCDHKLIVLIIIKMKVLYAIDIFVKLIYSHELWFHVFWTFRLHYRFVWFSFICILLNSHINVPDVKVKNDILTSYILLYTPNVILVNSARCYCIPECVDLI